MCIFDEVDLGQKMRIDKATVEMLGQGQSNLEMAFKAEMPSQQNMCAEMLQFLELPQPSSRSSG